MKIEVGKSYRTRDGRKVDVVCTNLAETAYPVLGLLTEIGGMAYETWALTGDYALTDVLERSTGSRYDLVSEWREPQTYWVFVWGNNPQPSASCYCYSSKDLAVQNASCFDPRPRIVKLVEVSE